MDGLKIYFDQIKAEDELKEKTKDRIMSYLTKEDRRKQRPAKRLAVMAAVTACALLLVFSYTIYRRPVNYITLDINPSVEVALNIFDKVVSAKGINTDGELLIAGLKLKNRSVTKAFDMLVQEASGQEYIAADGSTVIALTVSSADEEKIQELQDQSGQGVQNALRVTSRSAILYKDCSAPLLREEAQELRISPGKLRLIKILQDLEPQIETSQIADIRISDIMGMIKESADDPVSGIADPGQAVERIRNTVSMIREARGDTYEEQNQYNEQNQNQNQGQEQGLKETEQEQNQNQNQAQETGATETEQEQNQNQGQEPSSKETEQEQNQNQDQDPGGNGTQGGSENGGSQGSSGNSSGHGN